MTLLRRSPRWIWGNSALFLTSPLSDAATHSVNSLPQQTSANARNVYEGQLHVPVQPPASQTSQSVVRILHFDRRRVITANQIIMRSHPIHGETCNEFFSVLDPFRSRSAASHVVSRPERIGELGILQSSNGEVNPSGTSGITEAHLPGSECRSSSPLGDRKYYLILLSHMFRPQVRPADSPE